MPKTEEQLRGIGGWLILMALAIVSMPSTLLMAYEKAAHLFEMPVLRAHMAADLNWQALAFVETAGNGIAILPSVILIFLFFFKHRWFSMAFSFFAAYLVTVHLTQSYLVYAIPTISPTFRVSILLRSIYATVALTAWVTYVFRSRRVRLTFTRRFYFTPSFPFFSTM